ncbi:metalloregulator ArsR/SmtB family transcription factor [Longispora sp. NPDC051575]|uniref:ArsR/SmtB family transcription factor n=1 Tax=Longispora sp. NPDC051575 TaxID=3154943 RepID=UPI00342CD6B8
MDTAAGLTDSTRDFLRALASDTRMQIVFLFADGSSRSVGEIATELGIGQSTASEQLALLRRGGVVRADREGKTVNYRADPDGIRAALDELQVRLAACCPPGT